MSIAKGFPWGGGVPRTRVVAAVFILSVVQAFLAVHQVEHWDHPEEATSCEVCLPGAGLDQGQAAPPPFLAGSPGAWAGPFVTLAGFPHPTTLHRRARGPPPETSPA